MLIEDVLEYSIGFFDEGDTTKGYDSVVTDELVDYAKTFCNTVNGILQFGKQRASATIYTGEAPIRLVSVCFDNRRKEEIIDIQITSKQLEQELTNLEKRTQTRFAENLYVRRNIKLYEENMLHIVKPNEKRFWTRSIALCDADEVLVEGINGS